MELLKGRSLEAITREARDVGVAPQLALLATPPAPQPTGARLLVPIDTFTFTCAAVWAGLTAAAELANLFNDQERRATWWKAAGEVREAMRTHLWLENEGRVLMPLGQ